jgi:ankyrin repeat protein
MSINTKARHCRADFCPQLLSLSPTRVCVPSMATITKQLVTAIEHNDVSLVASLLEQRASSTSVYYGSTPLHAAVRTGNVALVATLLDTNAPIDTATGDGSSLLLVACQCQHPDVVRELLSRRASVNLCENRWYHTPLHEAAKRKNEQLLMMLIDAGADLKAVNVHRTNQPTNQLTSQSVSQSVGYLATDGCDSNAQKIRQTALDSIRGSPLVPLMNARGAHATSISTSIP